MIAPDTTPDLLDRVTEWLVKHAALPAESAKQFEADARAEFGGELAHIRKVSQSERAERVRAVLAKFNGRNATTLARELGCGRSTVYEYLKQARAERTRNTIAAKVEKRNERRGKVQE